jgi:5-methylthioadenosine/S-adenosylhomocysteine deaminase
MSHTCDLLVQAGLLMTLDDHGTVQTDAALAISGGRILATGPRAAMAAAWQPARRLGSDHHLVMPGLVNTHNHTPLTLVRDMVEDAGFAPAYLPNVPQGDAFSEEDAYLLARLGA